MDLTLNGLIDVNANAIEDLAARVTTNEGDIDTAQEDILALESDLDDFEAAALIETYYERNNAPIEFTATTDE